MTNNITEVTLPPNVISKFSLKQNYPNPFNPETYISYQLANTSNVKLSVFDLNGRQIILLVNQQQKAGSYTVKFDAGILASGFYFYKLETENFSETRKMLLVK